MGDLSYSRRKRMAMGGTSAQEVDSLLRQRTKSSIMFRTNGDVVETEQRLLSQTMQSKQRSWNPCRRPAMKLRSAGPWLALILMLVPVDQAQTRDEHTGSTKSPLRFSDQPFDFSRTAVKGLYIGNNAVSVYSSLLIHEPSFTKSEFETTAAFEDRLQAFSSKTLFGMMTPKDQYAFSVIPTVSYDADDQLMKVGLGDRSLGDPLRMVWSSATVDKGSYLGSNSFGVKRTIRRLQTIAYYIQSDEPEWFSSQFTDKAKFTDQDGFLLPEPSPVARRLSSSMRVLLIGRLVYPFATQETFAGNPTTDNPVDRSVVERSIHVALKAVWLYDFISGEVIKKYDEETFEEKWPVRLQLACAECNELNLQITVDGKDRSSVNLRSTSSRSAPISLHALESIEIQTTDLTEAAKWKITEADSELKWDCVPGTGYLSSNICTVSFPVRAKVGTTPAIAAAEAHGASNPIRISGGVMAGNLLNKFDPVYPPIARAAHVSGAVVLHAIISRQGLVQDATVISGPEMLRASALEAVKQWVYKPYISEGSASEVDTTITVNFSFSSAPPKNQ